MEGLRRPYLVAEIGSNWNGSIDRALALIDAAALAGFSAVKFQHYRLERLFSPWALEHHPELLERRRYELPDWAPIALARHARRKGLQYGATYFDMTTWDEEGDLPGYDPDLVKVSSYDILNLDLLYDLAYSTAGDLPIILSTGMATLEEVQEAVEALRQGGCQDLTLLHCVSLYPTRPEEANLRAIQTLREAFPGCKVGWSDHTGSTHVCMAAWRRWGAECLELHFDLDGLGAEASHSWRPEDVELLLRHWENASRGDFARLDGTGLKGPQLREIPERLWRADPTDGLRPLKEARR